ncbi:MAG: CDP-alcohol phosphatidyltransferase family protein [Actinomycetota bacterium]
MPEQGEPGAPFGRGRVRKLFGLDRTGPRPLPSRAGEPLRPFTIPNLVGYLRLAAIPVFLYIAFESDEGRSAAAAAIFWLIAVGDYVDGFLARATGQYSRMGALLDPVVDRLTILAGTAVCWHFHLLPRWALAVLAARELVTLALAQIAVRRGVELEVNWLGRVAVWPIMAAIFFAMISQSWVWDAMLIGGLAISWLATLLYVRIGLQAPHEPAPR